MFQIDEWLLCCDFVSEFSCLIRACDQVSELVHCLQTRLRANSSTSQSLPSSLSAPIRNIVIGEMVHFIAWYPHSVKLIEQTICIR